MDRKAAIATVADEFGIAKRLVYAAVVDANKMSPVSYTHLRQRLCKHAQYVAHR